MTEYRYIPLRKEMWEELFERKSKFERETNRSISYSDMIGRLLKQVDECPARKSE